MRELVIAERQALGGLAGGMAEPRGFLAAQKLAAGLSRGRLTAAHEELLYGLRKPEDRFARDTLTRPGYQAAGRCPGWFHSPRQSTLRHGLAD